MRGLMIIAAVAFAGCGDMLIHGRSSGRVYPPMNLDRVSARLEAPRFDKVKIRRSAASYEPWPTVSAGERAASQEQVDAIHDLLVRGFTTRLIPYANANGLRIVPQGPEVAALSFVPAAATTGCEKTGCASWIDLKVELRGRDGAVAWTCEGSLSLGCRVPSDARFDQALKHLFQAMRRDGVLP